ncbi:MAG: GHMP family kinase ATP-binding protein [Anaerolineae bacterium]
MLAHRHPRFVLILAAGKGTRMGSSDRHKVCFSVDGRPVINRAIEVYLASGILQPIVVVGVLASQVMATIALEHNDVMYAYQAEPLGTGHAARLGLRALYPGLAEQDEDVLLVAGDRIIDPQVLDQLYDQYYQNNCDLTFLVAEKSPRSEQGRVVLNGSRVLGLVEVRDIWQRQALSKLTQFLDNGQILSRDKAYSILMEHMNEHQAAVAFGDLWQRLPNLPAEPSRNAWEALLLNMATEFTFTRPDQELTKLTPDEVDATSVVNVSVYLLKLSALEYALAHLTRNNAQREEYLSDIVNILVQEGYAVQALQVSDPRQVLGYNNPAELLAVEAYFRSKRTFRISSFPALGAGFIKISEWLADLEACQNTAAGASAKCSVRQEFERIYGQDPTLLHERLQAYLDLLHYAAQVLPDDPPVAIVRSPGRANILGRHIDHQGGHCNLLAIDREILMVVHPRQDDAITLHNTNCSEFTDCHFSIGELVASLPWDDWVSLVNSRPVQELVGSTKGNWSHYVRAAVLRLQKRYTDRTLRGMDLVVHGNIPVAAGLSSSSALVVATAEATMAINALDVQPAQFVDLCGEGEWFVGTRGGSADHAAMKYSQKGKVTQVSFFPFALVKTVDFPSDYRLVICNSGVQARKAAGARDVFNHRVACYRLGLQLVKSKYPQYAPLLQHLRDINARNLAIPLSWIYRIVLSLPECISRTELEALLPTDVLEPLLATHAPQPGGYPIRGVVLFGLSEFERSRTGADLLAEGRVIEFGRLMNASHNGDRVVCYERDGVAQPYQYQVSHEYLLHLISDLESGAPEKVQAAQLEWQPGAYRCSTPEIDRMVDLALEVPGVVGAQLAGAGLGGCMMVLAHHTATAVLVEHLTASYYAPRGASPDMSVCIPIAGSGVLLGPEKKEASCSARLLECKR